MMMVGDGGDGGGHGDDDGLRIEGASRVWSRREVSRVEIPESRYTL